MHQNITAILDNAFFWIAANWKHKLHFLYFPYGSKLSVPRQIPQSYKRRKLRVLMTLWFSLPCSNYTKAFWVQQDIPCGDCVIHKSQTALPLFFCWKKLQQLWKKNSSVKAGYMWVVLCDVVISLLQSDNYFWIKQKETKTELLASCWDNLTSK